ncbi:MAG: protein arginine N-methyltransferase [Nannocystaceae bacterium]
MSSSSDSILGPRPGQRGDCLRHAYRPRDHDQLAQVLARHPCSGCGGGGGRAGNRWTGEPESHHLGPLVYCTLQQTCDCGLSTTVFVVLNDVLRDADQPCPSAEDALDQIEDLLPPLELERGLSTIRDMLHRGQVAEAVLRAEALVERFPERPECHFNAGCARQRLGDAVGALAHYRGCLTLHPQLAAAWLNRGLLLQRFGRAEEAQFCLGRARQAGGVDVPPAALGRVLGQVQGSFDLLRVIDNDDLRALYIGPQCQGAMYLATDDEGPRPGPYAHSPFSKAWLLAGSRCPSGRGLMLGLGSGAGAIMLLSAFPGLRLRVVEIDPRLIELALRYFPRLAHLRREGRLELVAGDAREAIARPARGNRWDFTLLDLFTGTPTPPSLVHDPVFMANVAGSAPLVMTNAIFTLGDQQQHAWLAAFERAGAPITRLYPSAAPEAWPSGPNNFILSTIDIDPPADLVPFAGSSHYLAEALRNDVRAMVRYALAVPRPAVVEHEGHGPSVAAP